MPKTTLASILCITLLLAIALLKDIDGTLLSAGIAAVAGLGGWAVHKVKKP